MTNQELFELCVEERGDACEMCAWNKAVDPHHCIVHKRKGRPEFDATWNIELLCRKCHSDGYCNSYEHRGGFWSRQKERGYPIKEIYDSLPLKKKEHFE